MGSFAFFNKPILANNLVPCVEQWRPRVTILAQGFLRGRDCEDAGIGSQVEGRLSPLGQRKLLCHGCLWLESGCESHHCLSCSADRFMSASTNGAATAANINARIAIRECDERKRTFWEASLHHNAPRCSERAGVAETERSASSSQGLVAEVSEYGLSASVFWRLRLGARAE